MPFVVPPGTPKDRIEILQEGMRKVFKDAEFRAEFKKVITDDASPLMPEELTKIIQEMPRDPEVIDMLKKMSGVEPLPSRQQRRASHDARRRRRKARVANRRCQNRSIKMLLNRPAG